MLPMRLSRKRQGRHCFWMVAVLGGILFLAACRSEFLPTTARVEAGVVDDMQSMGKQIVAKTSESDYWDGETRVTDVVISDVGGASAAEALTTAANVLKRRGWVAVGRSLDWVQMESEKWPNTRLTLKSYVNYETSTLMAKPEVAKAIKTALFRTKPESLVVADIYPTG